MSYEFRGLSLVVSGRVCEPERYVAAAQGIEGVAFGEVMGDLRSKKRVVEEVNAESASRLADCVERPRRGFDVE